MQESERINQMENKDTEVAADPNELWSKAIDAFLNGKLDEFGDINESLEIIKINSLYKEERSEIKEVQERVKEAQEAFEYTGNKGEILRF